MNANSRAAYDNVKSKLPNRHAQIEAAVQALGEATTNEIRQYLRSRGLLNADVNDNTHARLSELVRQGRLRSLGSVIDPISGESVNNYVVGDGEPLPKLHRAQQERGLQAKLKMLEAERHRLLRLARQWQRWAEHLERRLKVLEADEKTDNRLLER